MLEKSPCLGIYQGVAGDKGAKRASTLSRSTKQSTPRETVLDALDDLIRSLEEAKQSTLPSGILTAQLEKKVSKCSKTINEKHKEYYNSLSKLGKALDRKFVIPIDGVADYSLFQSDLAQGALNKVIRDHLMRCGEWDVARNFSRVSKNRCREWPQMLIAERAGGKTARHTITVTRGLSQAALDIERHQVGECFQCHCMGGS